MRDDIAVLALVGMPGSGKSSVGRRLARRLRREMADSDEFVEKRAGRSIPEIFEAEGEAAFRRMESEALEELLKRDNLLLSTGGGIVLSETNRESLRSKAFVIYLAAGPELLWERTRRRTHRPLLRTEDPLRTLEDMLSIRRPLYESVADLVVDCDFETGVLDVCRRIEEALEV